MTMREKLFAHMQDEHGLTLVGSELEEIIRVVTEKENIMVDSVVGQSHDYCECGSRHDFDVPPGTEKIYRCDCERLVCHRTVPNAKNEVQL